MPRKKSGLFVKKEYDRAFNEKAYDRLNIVVPKGRKVDIDTLASERKQSVNKMVNEYFRGELGMSEEEWKSKGEENGNADSGQNP